MTYAPLSSWVQNVYSVCNVVYVVCVHLINIVSDDFILVFHVDLPQLPQLLPTFLNYP